MVLHIGLEPITRRFWDAFLCHWDTVAYIDGKANPVLQLLSVLFRTRPIKHCHKWAHLHLCKSHLRPAGPRAASLTIVSRLGRGTSSKTHHPLWNGYTLRPLTQRSTSADTLPIALFSFLVYLRKHRASFNVGADLGPQYRAWTYDFHFVRVALFQLS